MEYAPLSVHADWLPVTPLMLWSGADKTAALRFGADRCRSTAAVAGCSCLDDVRISNWFVPSQHMHACILKISTMIISIKLLATIRYIIQYTTSF